MADSKPGAADAIGAVLARPVRAAHVLWLALIATVTLAPVGHDGARWALGAARYAFESGTAADVLTWALLGAAAWFAWALRYGT